MAIPIETQKGRSFLYIATVSSVQNGQVMVKCLRKIGNDGLYRDADSEDTSQEPAEICFICPEPQVNMVGTRLRYAFKFTGVQREVMERYATK